MTPDPEKQIKSLLADREAYYRIADLTINTNGLMPEAISKKILTHYQNSF